MGQGSGGETVLSEILARKKKKMSPKKGLIKKKQKRCSKVIKREKRKRAGFFEGNTQGIIDVAIGWINHDEN